MQLTSLVDCIFDVHVRMGFGSQPPNFCLSMALGLLRHEFRADCNCCCNMDIIGEAFQPYTIIKAIEEARIVELAKTLTRCWYLCWNRC